MTSNGPQGVPLVFHEERPVTGRTLPVQAGTVGRDGCDVNLADPDVSRRHAAIRATEGGGMTIEDLGSRNGVWLNDRRLETATALRPGDVVRIGRTVWRVTSG